MADIRLLFPCISARTDVVLFGEAIVQAKENEYQC